MLAQLRADEFGVIRERVEGERDAARLADFDRPVRALGRDEVESAAVEHEAEEGVGFL